jgi:hypothetical protein
MYHLGKVLYHNKQQLNSYVPMYGLDAGKTVHTFRSYQLHIPSMVLPTA